MVGRTLADIRDRLSELNVAVGPYRVVSARTGTPPFPVSGMQFPDRETAVEAASVATAYRSALRRYDPRVTVHGLIVCEAPWGTNAVRTGPSSLPEYCHTVAGSLFEVLSGRHRSVEQAVIDSYLEAAEETENRERLCLAMLESMATALEEHLDPERQADTLREAAGQLPRKPSGPEPVRDAIADLETAGLVDEAAIEPAAAGPGRCSRYITLQNYRPTLSDLRCPVLPIAVELLRRTSITPQMAQAERTADGWRLLVSLAGDQPAEGLSVVRTTA
ncbi:DUF7551 domain-containing protein [Haloarcula japonica]|uniref:Uncharacterized protein n=1 Tax=Haloarcula japonica (strain ATCC 49778 / DSM 6131 / JCM 7785 / NBRC 101032 / NCIMB 13157 / TR-1) TaxID=1227453 RepID=M0LEA7_HALJT|nr:hypothetical protein [Haloarcula japonica]EMA30305.1 hypothetical protein C444_10494 [Haloarcula japonica DSM 6131]